MAKNKKPKFLEAETPDLLALLKETLSEDEVDEKAATKANKIIDELISRQPGEEGPVSVDEALKAAAESMTEALNKIKGAYENEISLMEESEKDQEPDEDEEEAPKKEKKSKKSKKSKKEVEPEEDEEEDEDEEESEEESDDDGEDYSDWATKDLKKECRNRGIKVTKGMAKADMVKALEADDQE